MHEYVSYGIKYKKMNLAKNPLYQRYLSVDRTRGGWWKKEKIARLTNTRLVTRKKITKQTQPFCSMSFTF